MVIRIAAFVTYLKLYTTCFFQCSYARFLWPAIQVSFGINIPANKDELFSHWLRPNGPKTNTLLLVAAAALIWAIWLTRNEVIYKTYKVSPH